MDEILDFWRHAARYPDSLAMVDERAREWSAGHLLGEVNRISHGLRALGVRKADVVAVLMPKCAEFVCISLATSQIGVYLVTLNPHLALPELRYILLDSGARILLLHEAVARSNLVAELRRGTSIECIAIGNVEGCRSFDKIFADQPTSLPAERVAGTLLTYTSGTTGRPKAVLRPIRTTPAEEILRPWIKWYMNTFSVPARSGGVHLCACPLHYGGPFLFASYALHLGHTLVLMPVWHPKIALYLIQKYGVTTTFMVPSQFVALLKLPAHVRERYSTASLRCVIHGSAPCPEKIKREMLDWWGPIIYDCYGSTEVGGTVASPSEWLKFPGTVGRAQWPHEVRIYDDAGNVLPPGHVGTVYLRVTPDRDFIYKDDPEKTRACRRGDFVTVGDVGYLNEAGFLFLLDRKSDMIICRGTNIYPAELESTLVSHPAVADCAAFGIPHEEWGEEVRMAVLLAPGIQPSTQLRAEILAFLRSRIAAAKCPRDIEFVNSIPRDEGGKLRRRELREAYLRTSVSRWGEGLPNSAREGSR